MQNTFFLIGKKKLYTCSTLLFVISKTTTFARAARSHHCYIIFMFFFQRNWFPLLFISRSSSLPVIQVNVDIKILWKERLVFFCLKVRPCNFPPNRAGCLKCKNFTSSKTYSSPDGLTRDPLPLP